MKIVICSNEREGSVYVSSILRKAMKKKSTLGLATGKTMIPIYRELVRLYKRKTISFKKVTSFNLDEYYPVERANPRSFYQFMKKNLFDLVDLPQEQIHFLDGSTKEVQRECSRYERELRRAKIDIQLLGIGRNGHIAFNEPGSEKNSKTRKIKLSESTLRDNFGFRHKTAPKYALTMGVSSVLSARKVILVAFGKKKAGAIRNALIAKPSAQTPASFLQLHRDLIVVLDKKAAVGLKNNLKD